MLLNHVQWRSNGDSRVKKKKFRKNGIKKKYVDLVDTFKKDRRGNAIGDVRFDGSAFMNIATKLILRLKKYATSLLRSVDNFICDYFYVSNNFVVNK